MFVTNDSLERVRPIFYNLVWSSLDGLLVSISSDSDSCQHFQEVINKHIPVVFFDGVPAHINTSKVMQDDYNGAFEALEPLIANQYKKIAFIAGPKNFCLQKEDYRVIPLH